MKVFLKNINLLFFILCLSSSIFAQGNSSVNFTAYADAKEVLLNSYFELTFTLKNGEGTSFTPPDFSNFKILSGPNQGFQTTIVNGRMSQETNISYRLQARRIGTLSIGSASIVVKGQRLTTAPLSVNVVRPQAGAGEDNPEVFLTARIKQDDVFLGQQLVLDYILSSRVEVEGLSAVSESDYEGFYSREIHQYDTRGIRELVNGTQYVSRILKRVVLYPQQTGVLTIDPLSIVAGIPIPGQRSGGFFSRQELRRVPISSQSIELSVIPLPEPRAARFSGITGNFRLRANLNRNRITTDDAISLKLTLEGQGDLKRIQAPDLMLPEAFELYDPKVLEEEYYDLSSSIKGRKTFEYLLVPKEVGNFSFHPEVVVFNPDSLKYETLTVNPLSLEVKAGSGEKKSGLVAEAEQNQGLFPPRPGIELVRQEIRFFNKPLFWLLFLLPFLAIGSFILFKQIQANRPDIDPVLLKQQRARQQALKRLQLAETHRQKNDARAFYAEVEKALLGYVGDKLQIARAEMTKTNVQSKLEQLGANNDQSSLFLQLIRSCEMALYAGMDNADAMEETYTKAVALLSEMEEVLGK